MESRPRENSTQVPFFVVSTFVFLLSSLPIFAGTRLLMVVYSRTISTNSRDWRQLEGPAMEAGSHSHCAYCSEIEDLKVTLQLQCGGQRNCLQEKRGSLANGIKSKIEKPRILILGGALKL
nr:hypothetical protein Itr_chr01CG08210 [Ipomoea trifida]